MQAALRRFLGRGRGTFETNFPGQPSAKLDSKRLLGRRLRTEPEKLIDYPLLLIVRNVVQHHDRLAHALGLFGTELFEDRVGGRPVETGH